MVAQLDVYDTLHPPIIGYSVLRIQEKEKENKVTWSERETEPVVVVFMDFH